MRTNEIRYRSVFGLLIFFGVVPALTIAQTREQTLQAISKLHGPEREAKIREGARKEGNLIWYSSTTADDSLVLSQKFQEIYPFVKVQHLRGPSEKMIERILMESRAGSFKADVVALPEIELELLVQRKLLLKHAGLEQQVFPANVKDPQGYWTGNLSHCVGDRLQYQAGFRSSSAQGICRPAQSQVEGFDRYGCRALLMVYHLLSLSRGTPGSGERYGLF